MQGNKERADVWYRYNDEWFTYYVNEASKKRVCALPKGATVIDGYTKKPVAPEECLYVDR